MSALHELSLFWDGLFKGNVILLESIHVLVTIPFAYFLYVKTKSFKFSLLVIFFSLAIDFDHLVDYFSFYGLNFNLDNFIMGRAIELSHKAYVPLHAWEWLIITGIMTKIKGYKSVWAVFFMTLLPHLAYDTLTVGSISFYSIVYRISVNYMM